MSYKKEIILNTFRELIFKESGKNIDKVESLKADASDRKIYRLYTNGETMIGVYNEFKKENIAFINFTQTFTDLGFNVPRIINVSDDNLFYLEEDLGDMTLYSITGSKMNGNVNRIDLYKRSLTDLVEFQVKAKDKIDYNYCYQTKEFDIQVIESDLRKFAEYFIVNNENAEFDQDIFKCILDQSEIILRQDYNGYFLYRDFQPRNIMLKSSRLYYIDYQSGRKGPLQYDLASFLFSGSIDISEEERDLLMEHYLNELEKQISFDRKEFVCNYYFFAFLRLLQMIGSYSYLIRKRNDTSLMNKIPKALFKLKGIMNKIDNEDIRKFILRLSLIV